MALCNMLILFQWSGLHVAFLLTVQVVYTYICISAKKAHSNSRYWKRRAIILTLRPSHFLDKCPHAGLGKLNLKCKVRAQILIIRNYQNPIGFQRELLCSLWFRTWGLRILYIGSWRVMNSIPCVTDSSTAPFIFIKVRWRDSVACHQVRYQK